MLEVILGHCHKQTAFLSDHLHEIRSDAELGSKQLF